MKNAPSLTVLKHALAALAFSTCTGSVLADTVGLRIGAYTWAPDFSGDVSTDGENVDLENDLGFTDDDATSFVIAIEHPIPVLPNLLLQHTQLDSSSTARLTRTFTFDDVVYTAADTVNSDLDLTHTDATFYYEVLDNWVELDLGLTVRHFGGEVKLEAVNAAKTASEDLSAVIPMIYAAARFNLPVTGLYVAVNGNGIGYGGNTLLDYRAMIGYETEIGLGAELGYRSFDIDYEDDDDTGKITVDGVYGQVFYHF